MVNERWGFPVKDQTLYRHMKRHQIKDIERSETLLKIQGKESAVWQRTAGNRSIKKNPKEIIETTEKVIEGTPGRQAHEIGLDEFIEVGRAKLKIGDMNISAANYVTAIKIKAEIESKTKDRRLEMLRSMFSGAAPKQDNEQH